MNKERDYYRETIARLEPDIHPIDAGVGHASIAISLKRIAHSLEMMADNHATAPTREAPAPAPAPWVPPADLAGEFRNMMMGLRNIDGYRLPELTSREQSAFLRDPVLYFCEANYSHQQAIMREVIARQKPDSSFVQYLMAREAYFADPNDLLSPAAVRDAYFKNQDKAAQEALRRRNSKPENKD